MFVQCPKCQRHYDDSVRTDQCDDEEVHPTNGRERPVEEHVRNTRSAWQYHTPPEPPVGAYDD